MQNMFSLKIDKWTENARMEKDFGWYSMYACVCVCG